MLGFADSTQPTAICDRPPRLIHPAIALPTLDRGFDTLLHVEPGRIAIAPLGQRFSMPPLSHPIGSVIVFIDLLTRVLASPDKTLRLLD